MPLQANMNADHWDPNYVNEITGHVTGMQNAGVSALLTQTLTQGGPSDAYLLTSTGVNPRMFGSLRGQNSAVAAYESYIAQQFPGDKDEIIGLVKGYATGVRESSWANMVQIVKEFLVRQRVAPAPQHSGYFWKMAIDDVKPWQQAVADIQLLRNKYLGLPPGGDTVRQELNLRRAVVTWHAFTQELLRCTVFPGNDQGNETLTVVRTESASAAAYFHRQANGAALTANEIENPSTVYNVPLTCVRGALESSSLYTIKTIHGNIVTQSVVPHHRIFALYMTGQPSSVEHQLSFFENDTENEVTFMPQGLPFQITDPNQLAFARAAQAQALSWNDL